MSEKITSNGSAILSHLEFKNIPINGGLLEFVGQMKLIGFTEIDHDENSYLMKGRFVNMDCKVIIISTYISKIVCKVAAFGPEKKIWHEIKSDYQHLKELFIRKYGSPNDDFQFFSNPFCEGDGHEILALSTGDATYAAYWNFNNGTISISISTSAAILISYEDKINCEINVQETNNEILNEI